jgi:hypothetical protein
MRHKQLLLITATTASALFVFAQSGDNTSRHVIKPAATHFHLDDVGYTATIDAEAVYSSPQWMPAMALPLNFSSAEDIARRKLRELVPDEQRWEVTQFALHRLRRSDPPKWYYAIQFMPISLKPGLTNRYARRQPSM